MAPRLVSVEGPQPSEQGMLGHVDTRRECGDLVAERLELIGAQWLIECTDIGHSFDNAYLKIIGVWLLLGNRSGFYSER